MKYDAFEISIRPYKGRMFFATTREGFEAAHIELFGEPDPLDSTRSGRFSVGGNLQNQRCFLIWAEDVSSLAHEVAHVVLELFLVMKTNPTDEASEPFCYLLQQLFEDCFDIMQEHVTNK